MLSSIELPLQIVLSGTRTVINNLSAMIQQAKHKLTRLGLSLFYFYLGLVFLGIIGGTLALITSLQKLLLQGATLTAWWEVIMLGIVSYAMIKLFHREATRLLEADPAQAPEIDYEDTPPPETTTASNVIPFNRKPDLHS